LKLKGVHEVNWIANYMRQGEREAYTIIHMYTEDKGKNRNA